MQERRVDASEALNGAASAYDRLRDRAWRLAVWMTGDEAHASDAVIAAFLDRSSEADPDWRDDLALLRMVYGACVVGAVDADRSGERRLEQLGPGLSPLQREMVVLVLVAGTATSDVAARFDIASSDVGAMIAAALRPVRSGVAASSE